MSVKRKARAPVSATRSLRRCEVEFRSLEENLPFEGRQGRRRLQAQFFGEAAAQSLERREGVGLPSQAIERDHLLRSEPLVERVLGHQRLDNFERFGRRPAGEVGLRQFLGGPEAGFVEAGGGHPGEVTVGDVVQRRAPPERQRIP